MKNYGKRKIPRDIFEFEDLIKPYYDSRNYQYAYDTLVSFWKRKGKSIRSSSLMWEPYIATVFSGELEVDLLHISINFDAGFEEYAYEYKSELMPKIEKLFAFRFGSLIDFLKEFYINIEWVSNRKFKFTYYETSYYLSKVPKQLEYHSSWQYALVNNSPSDMSYLIINHHLMSVFETVEREFRVSNGLSANPSKWKSEGLLLDKLKVYFSEQIIIGQGSPVWLGLQRFDIWIPEHNIAVEYNGKQHYEPVEFFGGEKGFKNTQRLDHLKRQKCLENNATLLELQEGYNFKELATNISNLIKSKE